ncbi:FtsK/SpoIIIE domain-containing protein [Tuberibacillus calidus]|uniref:FtsK/SpoIIIE domain-containing protein n=1 Tax=Tuberibacillus calidus TaxID=340097 RepID=UPI0004076846|nr:FtsK/SpoIIIE domain-containing protein [Tuberibacillus calidus]
MFFNKDSLMLKKAFRAGEIYLNYKNGSKVLQVYPKVHAITDKGSHKQFVFTLPTGFDPKIVKKNEYAFKQVFGDNIHLDGDVKKFVLTVFKNSMPKTLKYDFKRFKEHLTGEIPILVGVNHSGQIITYDMAQYPHLLIAGETGSGKSTQLRSILTTLILNNNPDELRLILGDLKRSEFHVFRRVIHVDSISTNVHDLLSALISIESELQQRGDLLDHYEKAHIKDLPVKLPNIIVCIDEVALLKAEKEIMFILEDISAIGRALGVYLILSMQRPDRDVLNGKLKNNLTVRMAFKHSDKINSEITLGRGTGYNAGDISIETPGRMYFKRENIEEIQTPYLDLEKAKKLLEPFKSKTNKAAKNRRSTNDLSNIFGMLGDE